MRVGSFQNDNPHFQYRPNTSSVFPILSILNIHVRILILRSLRQIQTELVIVGFILPFASPTRRHFPNHPILPEPSNTPPSPTAVGEGRGEGRFLSNHKPHFQYRPNASFLVPILNILNIHVRILFLRSLRQIQTELVIVGFIPPFASPTRRHFPNHPILPEPSNTPPSPTAVGEGRGEGRFYSKPQTAFPISPKHLIPFPHPVHPEHPCENSFPAFLAVKSKPNW